MLLDVFKPIIKRKVKVALTEANNSSWRIVTYKARIGMNPLTQVIDFSSDEDDRDLPRLQLGHHVIL
jgi:hypothetical protein